LAATKILQSAKKKIVNNYKNMDKEHDQFLDVPTKERRLTWLTCVGQNNEKAMGAAQHSFGTEWMSADRQMPSLKTGRVEPKSWLI
jgi:hypothetical protein